MAAAINRIIKCIQTLEHCFWSSFGFRSNHYVPALASVGNIPVPANKTDLESLLNEHILWAVPKKRRSIQVRRCRRFGWPQYVWKPLIPKTDILVCNKCGGFKEAGLLCPTCYNKIRLETHEMQEAIQKELGLSPVEKDVVVLYEGENTEQYSEYWQGKRIVEMKKERPPLFSKNLLQPSTQVPAETADVKPTDLA